MVRRSWGGVILFLAVGVCLCVGFTYVSRAQTSQTTKQGNTLSGDNNGALVPGVPFGCNVDQNVFPSIASCVSFLTSSGTAITVKNALGSSLSSRSIFR